MSEQQIQRPIETIPVKVSKCPLQYRVPMSECGFTEEGPHTDRTYVLGRTFTHPTLRCQMKVDEFELDESGDMATVLCSIVSSKSG